jgi:hypothetical protein
MMGNTKQFGDPYPLRYMTPPFTRGRYDENGNWIPPFDARQIDSSGRMRYQSALRRRGTKRNRAALAAD